MPLQPTAAQIAASRRNGARSRGPKTAAGKAISARNATVHALTSRQASFPPVDPAFLQTHLTALAPHNVREIRLVEEMAEARWRARLCGALEIELHNRYYPPDSTNPAAAYMARPAAFATVWVAEGRHQRTHQRLFRELLALRRNTKLRELDLLENEPKPGSVASITQAAAASSCETHQNKPKSRPSPVTRDHGSQTPAAPTSREAHGKEPEPSTSAVNPRCCWMHPSSRRRSKARNRTCAVPGPRNRTSPRADSSRPRLE